MSENNLITKKDVKDIAAAIDDEIKNDYKDRVKNILVKKR